MPMASQACSGRAAVGPDRGWAGLRSFGALLPYYRMVIVILSLGLIEWLTMARILRGRCSSCAKCNCHRGARDGQRADRHHVPPPSPESVDIDSHLSHPDDSGRHPTESFLGFLGLGIDEPAASWGSLLKQGAQVINPLESRWWLLAFPAAVLAATLLALNFLGDGLRDAFDPRSRE